MIKLQVKVGLQEEKAKKVKKLSYWKKVYKDQQLQVKLNLFRSWMKLYKKNKMVKQKTGLLTMLITQLRNREY